MPTISNYTASQLEKLTLIGEKALAIVAFEGVATGKARYTLRGDMSKTGLTLLFKEMPAGYTDSLEWLIKRYSTKEIKR